MKKEYKEVKVEIVLYEKMDVICNSKPFVDPDWTPIF